MITKPAAFRVKGIEPAPKGSMAGRCLTHPKVGSVCLTPQRVVISEDANRGRPFRRAIEKAAAVHMPEKAGKHQPLKVTVLFGITRTRAAEDREFPAVRSSQGIGGDLDKMVRLVLDALESAGVLTDDAQVIELSASKVFYDTCSDSPGLYCRIEPIGWEVVTQPPPPITPELSYEQLADEERIG